MNESTDSFRGWKWTSKNGLFSIFIPPNIFKYTVLFLYIFSHFPAPFPFNREKLEGHSNLPVNPRSIRTSFTEFINASASPDHRLFFLLLSSIFVANSRSLITLHLHHPIISQLENRVESLKKIFSILVSLYVCDVWQL